MSSKDGVLSVILVFTHLCFQMNLVLQLREVLVIENWSIEFDLFCLKMDECSIAAKQGTVHENQSISLILFFRHLCFQMNLVL